MSIRLLEAQVENLSVNSAFPLEVGAQEFVAIDCKVLFVPVDFGLVFLAINANTAHFFAKILQDRAALLPQADVLDLIFHELAKTLDESCLVEG